MSTAVGLDLIPFASGSRMFQETLHDMIRQLLINPKPMPCYNLPGATWTWTAGWTIRQIVDTKAPNLDLDEPPGRWEKIPTTTGTAGWRGWMARRLAASANCDWFW
ncbi:hypothetical protein quinque_014029 [Culex quinquefasciatus]